MVINEYNYINNYVELKVLDPTLTAGGANPFAGWKLALWKKQGQNMVKASEVDVSSNYTNVANNTCPAGGTGNYTYVRIPFASSAMTNDEVVVLWDSTGGKKIIDLFRLATTGLAVYPASINAGYANYDQCATIENALPSSAYDAPLVGSAGNKDIARLPDGTGPWTISPGSGAGSQQSPCGTNDALFNITKAPDSPTVGIGAANTFAWTINVSNGGTNGDLTNVIVSDTLPTNMFLSVCPAGFTCGGTVGAYTSFSSAAGSTFVPGALLTVTATAYVTAAGTYTNTVKATATELAPGFTQASGTVTASAIAGPEHVEFVHDGAALTCTPKAVTVLGCTTSASCNGVPANQYSASSFSISPAAIAGATWCGDSICTTPLANPVTVSNGSVIYLKDANVRTDRMSGISNASNTAIQCLNTSNSAFNAAAACDVSFAASGFLVSLPNHVSCTNSVLTVQAVQSNNNATNCVPMFRNRTLPETISFAYSNPNTGTLVPSVSGTAISTGGTVVNLSFDNNGIATPSFVYQDVGKLSITVIDASLAMTGTTSTLPVIAPASFSFGGITAGPIKAGGNFSATVTALNSCATPAVTPNFGMENSHLAAPANIPEGVALSFTKCQPTGTSSNGAFTGSVGAFASGVATATNLNWDEVGNGDLVATNSTYLGSSLTVTGNTSVSGAVCKDASGNSIAGKVGSFIPDHFVTTVADGCAGCGFTYSGQPFTVTVIAMNGLATPAKTFNYDGTINTSPNFANNVMLSDANAVATPVGVLGVAASPMGVVVNSVTPATTPPSTVLDVPKADFTQGEAVLAGVPTYTFNTSPVAPTTIKIRADDAVNAAVTSSGSTEGTTEIRSGRIKLSNAHGSELLPLPLTATVQYYNGTYWITSAT
ncbi:MAG: hypothetical protein A2061_06310, partial [Gallionellales bacterium GWA2_59_43]